jgi:Rha family phage regulatory protein
MNAASPQLSLINGHPVVTSLNLAEVFGKKHCDVLRAINSLEVPKEFTERNFASSDYKDGSGKKNPMFRITRDGFTLLVMGFTGTRAMQFKLAYIEAFNKMETELKARQEQPVLGLHELALAMKGIVDIQIHQSRLLERLTGQHSQPAALPEIPKIKARRTRKSWTAEEVRQVLHLRRQGRSDGQIGLELGRSRSSVSTLCTDFGDRRQQPLDHDAGKKPAVGEQRMLPFRSCPAQRLKGRIITAKERMEICRLLRRGHSIAEISEKTGRSRNTLYAAVRRWKKGGAR